MSSPVRLLELIEAVCGDFEATELRVLLNVARRLAHIRKVYGPLDSPTGRQFLRATGEELTDALIYLAFQQELDNVPAVAEADSLIRPMKNE